MTADPDHRKLGVDLFNSTWELMEKADRTPDEVLARAQTRSPETRPNQPAG